MFVGSKERRRQSFTTEHYLLKHAARFHSLLHCPLAPTSAPHTSTVIHGIDLHTQYITTMNNTFVTVFIIVVSVSY